MLVANSKVAALEAALAARSVEAVKLMRHLHSARQAVDPHIIQARAGCTAGRAALVSGRSQTVAGLPDLDRLLYCLLGCQRVFSCECSANAASRNVSSERRRNLH